MVLSKEGELTVSTNITSNNYTVNELISFQHQDTPLERTDHVQMYCKDDNRCFIMRDTGVERRLLDGGGGSFTIDEEIYFDNYTYFNYNMTLNATLITNDGAKFWSNTTCAFLGSPDGSNTLEVCNS